MVGPLRVEGGLNHKAKKKQEKMDEANMNHKKIMFFLYLPFVVGPLRGGGGVKPLKHKKNISPMI